MSVRSGIWQQGDARTACLGNLPKTAACIDGVIDTSGKRGHVASFHAQPGLSLAGVLLTSNPLKGSRWIARGMERMAVRY